jgi:hypothetical protein
MPHVRFGLNNVSLNLLPFFFSRHSSCPHRCTTAVDDSWVHIARRGEQEEGEKHAMPPKECKGYVYFSF